MYKGGCYLAGVAGPGIGTKMCKTAASGVCTVAADAKNYFVPPANTNDAHDSVVWCGDETGITLGSTQYKGIAKCKVCDAPSGAGAATCTTCEDGYFGNTCTACHQSCRTCSAADENSCTACAEGTHFLGAAGNGPGKCVSCGDASGETWKGVTNCAKCDKPVNENIPAACTECAEGYYLGTDGPTSCVADCGEGFFATTVGSVKKCVRCSDKTSGGIANCAECSLFPYK